MARSIDIIKSEIDSAIAADQELDQVDLNLSTSRVSIWRLWRNAIASAIFTLESLFDLHKTEVSRLSEALIYGKPDWYQAMAFYWQYGDSTSVVSGKIVYVPEDASKRLIKRCSVEENLGLVTLKVAKVALGVPTPLTNVEKQAFEFYLDRIKPAGIRTSVVSLAADLIWLDFTVDYRGELNADSVRTSVVSAVNDYLVTIEFTGVFRSTKLVDAIQKVNGVVDVTMNLIRVKSTQDESFQVVVKEHQSVSGYYRVDPDHPLSSNSQLRLQAV